MNAPQDTRPGNSNSPGNTGNSPNSLELAVFRLLMRAYGRPFCDRYGAELLTFFCRDRQRARYAGLGGAVRFWRHTLRDLAAAAAQERRLERTDAWRLDAVRQDLASAFRQVRADPVFALSAIFILAVAIGANSAVFSVVNGVVLRPLPYPEPHNLVSVLVRFMPESGFDFAAFPLSPAEAAAYGRDSEAMEEVAQYRSVDLTLTAPGQDPERVAGIALGDRALPLLRVRPELGRWFLPEEAMPGGPPVAILSHALWNGRYDLDPAVVGRTVTINGALTEIIGVMPAGFDFPSAEVRVYVPNQFDPADPGGWSEHGVMAVGRLAEGVTLAQAEDELAALNQAWRAEYGHPQAGHFLYLEELRGFTVGDVRAALWMLLAAVGLVLLIAAVNVASLMLARGETRAREVWLRMALGAGRGRVIRQMLTESLVLASVAAALGLALARVALDAVLLIDPDALPRAEGITIDLPVLLFTLVISMTTVIVFGLVPAFQAASADLSKDSRTTESAGKKRLRSILVSVEVAICVVVVLSAGLIGRSFAELSRVDSGFTADGRLTFGMFLPRSTYPSYEEVRVGIHALRENLEGVPGVESVAYTSALPIVGGGSYPSFSIEGRPLPGPGERELSALTTVVTPGYLQTMGIEVVAGRAFEPTDLEDRPLVALINQEAATAYWAGENPLGQFINFRGEGRPWVEIVGVIDDVRVGGPGEEIGPQIYVAFAQQQGFWNATSREGAFVLRTSGDPLAAVAAARRAVSEVDPLLPLDNIRTARDIVDSSLSQQRLTSSLLGSFAAIALLLALVGVYSIVSYSVARRTREIGIRKALGAGRGQVLWLMVREGATPALTGLAVGLGLSLLVTSALADLLFQVSPHDPLTFIALPVILATVAILASWIPSLRAMRVTPVEALRGD